MSKLYLPPSAMPKYGCDICGDQFWELEKQVRHVALCARKNREVLNEMAAAHRAADPLEQAIDQEALDFQRRKYPELQ